MELDRGRLGDIDRKILDSLDRDKRYQMVRVPVSDAVWSTWRRYCRAVGVSMGRGIAGLVAHELGVVIDPDTAGGSVYVAEMQRRFVTRSRRVSMLENAASTNGNGRCGHPNGGSGHEPRRWDRRSG